MPEWGQARVGSLVAQVSSGGTPTAGDPRYYAENGIPFLKINDLSRACGRFVRQAEQSITEAGLRESSAMVFPTGTVLVTMYGTMGLVKTLAAPMATNQAIAALLGPFDCDSDYLALVLDFLRPQLERMASRTTQPNLNAKAVGEFTVPLPSRIEQRRIAEVLDAIDDTVRATERVIDKLTTIRISIANELLTPGLSEDPPLGWRLLPIEDLLGAHQPAMRSGPFGSSLLASELVDEGVPLLGIDNVHRERFVDEYTRFVTPEKAQELNRYRVFSGDLMITIMGTVGRCCVVPDGITLALSSKHVWTVSLNSELYSPELACLQINHSPWALAHLRRDEQGGIMSAIRSDTLRSLPLPVPPMDELRRIVGVLDATSTRLRLETARLHMLRRTRAGLASDLLSGRVRTMAT